MEGFKGMGLGEDILKALSDMGITEPMKIQKECIPQILSGKDVLGQAETGSGKTAAFGLPIAEKLEHGKGICALIVTPTRELAEQVAKEMLKFSKHRTLSVATVYGGVAIEPQMEKLRTADIVVGTPGRILDHMERKTINLSRVRFLVLDEADRMLDMGFIDDVERIISATPPERQTLLFSATMPWIFLEMSKKYMKDPFKVSLGRKVEEALLRQEYYEVEQGRKFSLLVHIIQKENPRMGMVFCNSRFMADAVADNLKRIGFEAYSIHGGHSQDKRNKIMEHFHAGRIHLLVATDVAARGLDIREVTHVFNYDVPKDPKDYMHRIGRTGRAGDKGKAITLLTRDDHNMFRRTIESNRVIVEQGKTGRYDSIPFHRPEGRRVRGRQGFRGTAPRRSQRSGLHRTHGRPRR